MIVILNAHTYKREGGWSSQVSAGDVEFNISGDSVSITVEDEGCLVKRYVDRDELKLLAQLLLIENPEKS